MSEHEFEREDVLPFEETGFDKKVWKAVERRLREPSSLPAEFRTWLPSYIETANIQVPFTQIVGQLQVTESIADLGGDVHGRPGVVRVGAAPYDYFNLVYDKVADQWVSFR